jgi:cysteine desulfurase
MLTRRTVYLDHAATTPTDPRVVEAMLPYFSDVFGNTHSAHSLGRRAEQAIEDARERMSRVLGCKPGEIVFTSGGSESDNLAVRGAAWSRQRDQGRDHLVTTPVEHSAVVRTVGQLAALMHFSETIVPVGADGLIDVEDFAAALTPKTALASVMYANNEVGTVNPIPQLAAQAHEQGALFHTDAVQAAGQLTLDVRTLSVDLLSLSAHKFYGPKGVGALYVRDGIELVPSQSGGSHEDGRRAGTLNTPGIVGMAAALEIAYAEHDQRIAHYKRMRDGLIEGVLARVPGAQLTGHRTQRLPAHASFVFEGVESNMLLMHLDLKGIAASSASACKTGSPEPSGVLLAMGYPRDLALGSLRLTVGIHTTEDDVSYAVEALAASVEKVRAFARR